MFLHIPYNLGYHFSYKSGFKYCKWIPSIMSKFSLNHDSQKNKSIVGSPILSNNAELNHTRFVMKTNTGRAEQRFMKRVFVKEGNSKTKKQWIKPNRLINNKCECMGNLYIITRLAHTL